MVDIQGAVDGRVDVDGILVRVLRGGNNWGVHIDV